MKGTQHELVVESLANSGDGVGRIQDKVVFIPFACPGDHLKIEITRDKKSFCQAKIVEVLKASENRAKPQCSLFGRCGGCDWQHIQYPTQLQWKKQNLIDVLKRIGGFDLGSKVEKCQPSPLSYNYRNRIQFHLDKKGPHYFEKGSQRPCYFNQCPIASEALNLWLHENASSVGKPRGKWEIAETDDQSVEIFSVNEVGQSELGFRQVNTPQNLWIAEKIREIIDTQSLKRVVDLYCGQGNWSLEIARNNPEVDCIGIDINPTNIKKANSLALPNTKFILGDVMELYRNHPIQADLTIIDPPRAGCSIESIEWLKTHPTDWLVYISCHPASLARDLKLLCENAYEIQSTTPVDMFPQTSHLECFTILRSTKG